MNGRGLKSVMIRFRVCAVVLAAMAAGCGGGGGGGGPTSDCGTDTGTGCAPQSQRIDKYQPVFSNPLAVTNPLNPIANLATAVFLGSVDGNPFRSETTLLPGTRVITVNGVATETLQSQYMAFSDGRLAEIATNWYAQDDMGAAWYFGDDVAEYDETGLVISTDGTWLAGRDSAPPAMIMGPAPAVDQVWLAENVAPIAWGEITVSGINVSVDGPSGPITGAIRTSELQMDGTREEKVFAPGYGEFRTGTLAAQNLEALALAIPRDSLPGPPPAELDTLANGTADIFDAAGQANWTAADAALASVAGAWNTFQAGEVPPLLKSEMIQLLALLTPGVAARDSAEAREQAIAVARIVFDLRLRHLPPSEINQVRFDLWLAQIQVDAADALDFAGPVKGDVATLKLVLDRFRHTVDPTLLAALDTGLADLQAAATAEDATAAATIAGQLRASLVGIGWR